MAGEVTAAKLNTLKAGIADLLTKVDALIRAEAYAEKLPIIGDKVATASPALETLTSLSQALQLAVQAVAGLSNLSTKTTAEVAQALNDELAPRLAALASIANPFGGAVTATVNGTGDIVLVVDMGRTINLPFTLGDLGMSGLGLDLAGQANAQLAYNLDFRIGADSTGFWFDPSASPLSLTAKVDLNNLSVGANLGILHFAVSNIQDNAPAADADTLSFSIGSVWSTGGLIRNFSTDIVDFRATGTLDLDLHLQGDLSNAALPSIGADFHVDWGFSNSLLNGTGDNTGWVAPTVSFTNVNYNLGSYIETVVKPIVDTLTPVLKPINEALAIFRTDIQGALPPDWRVPFDFDGNGQVTLLDFIKKVGGIDVAPIQTLIDLIDQITDFAEFLIGKDFSDAGYNVGDYTTTFNAIQGAADALAGLNVTSAGFTSAAPSSFTDFLAGLAPGNASGFGAAGAATKIGNLVNNTTLSFPLIESPLQVIKLLLGQNIDMFKFDMPAINLGTGLNAQGNLTNPLTVFTLPIWPVPLVEVKVNVAAQLVADLAFGYDTAGIRYWMAQGSNPANVADIFTHGFYLDDQRSGATDIAEFVVRAAIELAVTASAGVTIGGGGNLIGSIALNLANALTTPDGKLHLSDFPTQFGIANPFAIFDVSGEISAGVRFWVDWPFGNIFNYQSNRLPIANFNTKQDATALGVSAAGNTPATQPPPPGLADVISGGLWIAVGPRSGERDIDNKADGAEIIQIGAGGTGKLAVVGFDESQLFNLSDFTTIQADGGNFNDEIVIDAGVGVAARISGGQGNDFLQGGDAADQLYGGTEDDYLAGGAGDDRLDGEDANDRLEGGAGADQLYGGNGIYDTATYANSSGVTLNLTNPLLNTGDALGDTFFSVEIYEGSRGNDTMIGSGLADIFTALDGDDNLVGMAGDDTLAPGRGTNQIDGGDGFDIVNYYNMPGAVTVTGSATAGSYTVTATGLSDQIVNVEQIDGSAYGDTMNGGAANDIFVGRDGNDVLDGGDGDDTLVGGAGADTLRGGGGDKDRASYFLSTVGVTANMLTPSANTGEAIGDTYQDIEGLRGSEFNDTLSGDDLNNLLQGGMGDDTLNGNGGADVLQGGAGADAMNGGASADTASYYNSATWVVLDLTNRANDENDAVGDSFNSIELYQGTKFSDRLTGAAGAEQLFGEEGSDRLRGMAGNDYLSGGVGSDELDGGANDDIIDGGDDGDDILGGAGTDTIRGGAAGDTAHGDADDDFVYGDGGDDYVYGDAGNDTVSGDAGGDHVYGGDDTDHVLGGDGDNFVYGDGGDDTLSGGQGTDLIDGGTGRDRVFYTDAGASGGAKINLSGAAKTVNGVVLAALQATDGFGQIDTFTAVGGVGTIEDVTGSAMGDSIVGHEGGSKIEGLEGNDTIYGLQGGDTIHGGAGGDWIDAGDGDDTVNGGEGGDILAGGIGTDWLTYEDLNGRVNANLKTGNSVDWNMATDSFSGFENLRGGIGSDTLTGDDGVNVIEGGLGLDIIDGGLGGDTMRGGDGDDTIYVDQIGSGGDTVDGGNGRDLIRISVDMLNNGVPWGFSGAEDFQLLGSARIAFGNSDSNTMMGNALDNVMDGLSGGDTFWGYGGNDTYVFDSLGDTIGTTDAYRFLTAGAGEVADGGNDTIRLATAAIYDGPFNNPTVHTYNLNRSDLAQVENVELTDDIRRVDLVGNDLGNRLVGNAQGSITSGEGGDDFLGTGTGGNDDIRGGSGLDTLIMEWGTAVNYVRTYTSPTANPTLGGYNGYFDSPSGGPSVVYTSIERFEITTGSGSDDIVTADGNDIVNLNGGNDFVNIGSGLDRADGGADRDGITADYGAETLAINWDLTANTYSEGTDGVANDRRAFTNFEYFGTLTTGSGNDVIVTRATDASETINTGIGDDRITVFEGADIVHAGTGLDTLVIDWSPNGNYKRTYTAPTANAAQGGWDGWYDTPSGGGQVRYTSIERFEITTGAGGDDITTANGDDIVNLNGGDDFVNIGSGLDRADGGTGRDGISANYGTDTLAINWDVTANTYSEGTDGTANDKRAFTNFEYFGTLTTGSGNDVIVTRTGVNDETINTGIGDDRITVFEGADVVHAGAGFDTLVIDWSVNGNYKRTYSAPAANATLGGWDGWYDTPSGGGQVRYTSIERFEITTGAGGDDITTADGNDIVTLNGGDDFVNIGSGLDRADGGTGRDGISANYGTDTLAIHWDLTANTYSEGADGIAGDTRTFTNFEYFGTLTTGSGDDVIVTKTGVNNETINTGAGNDRITVFEGADTVRGGLGFDTLVIDWSANSNGKRTYELPFATATLGGWSGSFDTPSGGGSVSYSSIERFEITTGGGGDNITVADGDDIVNLNGGDDFVNVVTGFDRADGGTGSDGVTANYGTDTLAILWNLTANTYSEGTDGIAGDRRAFTNFEYFGTLTTGSGNDVIVTTNVEASETINTGAGDDRIAVFNGADTVHAGTGFDTLVIDWSNNGNGKRTYVNPVVNGSLGGWDGWYDTPSGGAQVRYTSIERFEITTGSGGDDIVTADGDDIVTLNGGDDFVNIGSGLDRADGGAGRDGISANYATETQAIHWNLIANTYSEGADGTAGDTRAFTNFEYFGTITTGGGNDVIVTTTTGAGETINTGAGDDRISVFEGGDRVNGGAGNDTLVIDWSANGNYKRTYNAPTANATSGGWDGYYDTPSGGGNVAYTSIENFEIKTGGAGDDITTADGNDIVDTGAGNDTVNVGSGIDRADGGAGIDRISANYATDTTAINWNMLTNSYSDGVGRSIINFETVGTFVTGSGNDTIVSSKLAENDLFKTGAGDDVVTVYNGSDRVEGGDGVDTLIIDWSERNVWVANYEGANADPTGGFSGSYYNGSTNLFVSFKNIEKFVISTGNAGDDLRTGDGDDRVSLGGGNDRVFTNGGNDLIDGGTGDDYMNGGAGDDSYTVDSLGDTVDETVNGGIDSVQTALVAYTLAANVETLTGTNNLYGQKLTGNALGNVISGTVFGDTLNGGGGDDTLYGGTGNDFFVAGKGTNDQLFGDGGTDTVVIDGTLANWEFVQLGDGRVRMTDLRDAANAIAFLTSIERVEITGVGSITMAQAIAGNISAPAPGTTGNDVVTITVPGGLLDLSQGGSDRATGSNGPDVVLFGEAFDPTDQFDGAGGDDQIGLQGNYTVTFGPGVTGTEQLTLLSGSDTRFGASGSALFSYNLTTSNANVAGGVNYILQANQLLAGENLRFDGRAEADGTFILYAGQGVDQVTGGTGSDGFYFGNGRFTPLDSVDGFDGPDDQIGLRGDYSALLVLGPDSVKNIDTFVLISSTVARFGAPVTLSNFNIKSHDGNVAAGATMTIQAQTLQSNETAIFDGSAETNGMFYFIGGAGGDRFVGGAGADRFFGAGGIDTLTGGAGNDVFLYNREANSTPTAFDTITDFAAGDIIDLALVDAIAGGSNDAFTFVADGIFTGVAGQLRARAEGGFWFVEGDTNGDGTADLTIRVTSDHALTASDFIL